MIRLLLLALLFFLGYTLFQALVRALPRRNDRCGQEKTKRGEEMVLDPQCGTYLPRCDAVEKVIRGQKHFFCSAACRDAYLARK